MLNRLLSGLSAVVLWIPSAMASEPLVLSMRDDAQRAAAVVTAVAISTDGTRVFAGGDDHRIRVWDAESGARVTTLEGHSDWIRSLTLGQQPDEIASVAADHTVCLWDLKKQGNRPETRRLTDEALLAVVAHPDGRRLATAGFGKRLRLFDLSDTDKAPEVLSCPCTDTRAVAISPDGRWLAAAGRNGLLRLWDFNASGGSVDLPTDGRRVRALAFSPDGQTLAVGGDSSVIRLFRLNDGGGGFGGPEGVIDQLLVRPGKVHALAFVDDSKLAAGDSLNRIRLWDVDALSNAGAFDGHSGTVAALACSETAGRLVSGSFDTTVRVWEIGDAAPAATTADRRRDVTR